MKNKILKIFIGISIVGTCMVLASCGNNNGYQGTQIPGVTTTVLKADTPEEQLEAIYKIVLSNGYKGSFNNWMDSLKGDSSQLRVADGYIQWKLSGNKDWTDLIALADLKGPNGEDGKTPEFRVSEAAIEWKYTEDTTWNTLLSLASITGKDASEIELQVNNGFIEWKRTTDASWKELIELSSLIGHDGRKIEITADTESIKWRYEGEEDYSNLVSLADLKGSTGKSAYELAVEAGYNGTVEEWLSSLKGASGKEVELQVADGYIKWEYTGTDDWKNLISLELLKGENGTSGENGKEVEFCVADTYIQWRYSGTEDWKKLISVESLTGVKGEQGDTGNGIASILKTGTDGLVDTYTITYSDGTLSTFTVTNGANGIGIQGEKGSDGHTPVITIGENGNWYIDGVDTKKASSVTGNAGLSAYEIYVKYHPEYKGSEAEWIETLKGSDGTGITSVYIDDDGHLIVLYSDGNTSDIGAVQDMLSNGTDGLEYYLLPDGTYAVSQGTTKYLTEIVIPSKYRGKAVTQIDTEAFKDCKNITKLTLPSTITYIGDYAFNNCVSLEHIDYSDSNPIIGLNVYTGCESLDEVRINANQTIIEQNAFYNCKSITSVDLPDTITTISQNAFENCTGLKSITIPNSLKYIFSYAFNNCTSLNKVNYLGTLKEWCLISFSASIYTMIDDEGEHQVIEENEELFSALANPLFYAGNLYLSDVLVENIDFTGITQIKSGAFSGMNCITSIILPDTVTSIGYGIFCGCKNITEISVPYIGNQKDRPNNTSTLAFYFGGYYPVSDDSTYISVYYSVATSGLGCSGTYYIPSSLKKVTVRGGHINTGTFMNCANLEELIIGSDVEYIGSKFITGCTGLTKVTFEGDNSYSLIKGSTSMKYVAEDSVYVPNWSAYTSAGTITSSELNEQLLDSYSSTYEEYYIKKN